jgi:hypothetical protein
MTCGIDGTDYDLSQASVASILDLDLGTIVPFCPEDHSIGTPHPMPDIHGGDGFNVLDG